MLVGVLPASLSAADTVDAAGAILRTTGTGVSLNNNPAPSSSALFRDDVVSTEKTAIARIEMTGSQAEIAPETMLQFEGDELVLDHGSLLVNTGRGLKVRVGCITVTPVRDTVWTRYEVTDVNGKVTVSATTSDVYIDEKSRNEKEAKDPRHSSRVIVHESEQKSREEKCAGAYINPTKAPPGIGAILNSTWARVAGAGVVGLIACLGLCRSDDPISPSKPN